MMDKVISLSTFLDPNIMPKVLIKIIKQYVGYLPTRSWIKMWANLLEESVCMDDHVNPKDGFVDDIIASYMGLVEIKAEWRQCILGAFFPLFWDYASMNNVELFEAVRHFQPYSSWCGYLEIMTGPSRLTCDYCNRCSCRQFTLYVMDYAVWNPKTCTRQRLKLFECGQIFFADLTPSSSKPRQINTCSKRCKRRKRRLILTCCQVQNGNVIDRVPETILAALLHKSKHALW